MSDLPQSLATTDTRHGDMHVDLTGDDNDLTSEAENTTSLRLEKHESPPKRRKMEQ